MGHEGHDHEHDHAYMHEHNIPHEHEHAHDAEHDHAYMHEHNIPHTHEHEHAPANCGGNCASCSGDPRAELIAMMRYMVNHNAAHANELAGLAKQAKGMGDSMAYEQIMAAVSDFEKGNMRLSAVLAAMDTPNH